MSEDPGQIAHNVARNHLIEMYEQLDRDLLLERPTLHTLEDVAGVDLDEPTDIAEEPPCGSQVTDNDGEVWGRFEEGWQVWDALGHMEWSGVSDPWSVVRSFAPLRPTTDADRERVGMPVRYVHNHSPEEGEGLACREVIVDGALRGACMDEPAPADVDPDEALGALIWDRIWGTTWSIASEDNRDAYRNLARAVREHIEAERDR